MKIKFIGPASLMQDGGIKYPAKVDGQDHLCYFSYEVLEDIDPEAIFGDALAHFAKHQLKLLSIAEYKIFSGHAYAN